MKLPLNISTCYSDNGCRYLAIEDYHCNEIIGENGICQEDAEHIVKACNMFPELVDVLSELVDLMEDTINGEYKPDSFTTQPARNLLAKAKEDI